MSQMSQRPSVARLVDEAQSILRTPAAAEAARIEQAQARTCQAFAAAMARLWPGSGAGALALDAGVGIFAGLGSPVTQGLAMGLRGPVSAADLDAVEAFLRRGGQGPAQLELCPFADPSLPALLSTRGYRVNEWHLVWSQPVPARPPAPPQRPAEGLAVRRAGPGDVDTYLRAVMAGFLESEPEAVAMDALDMMRPMASAAGTELYVACLGGAVIGGAALSWADGVAFLCGSGVLPRFRQRGAQGALIRARVERARELGCQLLCTSTQPGTASRRNMERHGFSVAYPKVVMLKE